MKKYDKLVRTKIPDIIEVNGKTPECKQVDDWFVLASLLKDKLIEEALEVKEAVAHDDILEELADVQETLNCIRKMFGVSEKDLELVRKAKNIKRGSLIEKDESGNYQGVYLIGVS